MTEDPADLALVRQWAPTAKPGDALIAEWCDQSRDDELLNAARRMLPAR